MIFPATDVDKSEISQRTLNITQPIGQTLTMSLVILLLFMGAAEAAVRQRFVQSFLTTPSLNSRHLHFERQWHRLETLTKSGVQIQCLALGNSMVLNGFDPQIFSQSLYDRSGQDLQCFNFGVDGLTPMGADALARILIQTYQPKLLIVGADARDFAIEPDSEETSVIVDTAWVQYRLGVFNFEGWLVEHSYLYRYRHSLVDLMHLSIHRTPLPDTTRYGFEPYDTVFPINTPPSRSDDSYQVQYYYKVLGNYSVRLENEQAFEQILARQNTDLNIVVMEMPVPGTYFNFFDHPSGDYAGFISSLKTMTADHQVFFLETTRLHLIPDDGWMDYSHVNRKGATLLSTWLGHELGGYLADGKLRTTHP